MDMLPLSYGYGYASPSCRYGYASTRTSYKVDMLLLATDKDTLLPELSMGDMLLLSYGYRYARVRTSYGGHTPLPQALS